MIHARGFYHVGRIFQNQLLLDCKAQCFMKIIVNIAHCSSGKPALSPCFIKLLYISGLRPLQRNLPNVREDALFKVHPMPTHRIACQARFTVNAQPIPQIGLGGRGIFRAAKLCFPIPPCVPAALFRLPVWCPSCLPIAVSIFRLRLFRYSNRYTTGLFSFQRNRAFSHPPTTIVSSHS